jgi:hypothetical protein
MTKTTSFLEWRAGPRAIAHIREHGLRPEDVSIIPGAAGGPKGLGLAKLDEWLFADWLPQGFERRRNPVQLIGASIGAWRFASACAGTVDRQFSADKTRAALNLFTSTYSETRYGRKDSAAVVTADAKRLIDAMFAGREHTVLHHPHYRLHVLAVRGKGILAREQRGRTHVGYTLAAMANAAGRKHLRHFLDRTWFSALENIETPISTAFSTANSVEMPVNKGLCSPKNFSNRHAPLGEFFTNLKRDPFRTDYAALNADNLGAVLIATGSIPLVLEGVVGIPGATEGTYWDGGLIDYHLHLPYASSDGITLYPHFTGKIVPGWLDKMLPWRKARGAWLDNVVLLSPSRAYLDRLPMRKLPDRNDFMRYVDDYEGRLNYWRFAMAESARLRDEAIDAIERGDLVSRLQPL